MFEGLLYLDRLNKGLAQTIHDAAHSYRKRFGYWPTTCYVNADDLSASKDVRSEQIVSIANNAHITLSIVGAQNIAPNNVWIGIIGAPAQSAETPMLPAASKELE